MMGQHDDVFFHYMRGRADAKDDTTKWRTKADGLKAEIERLRAENKALLDIATRWVDTRKCSADTLDVMAAAAAGREQA